MTSRTVLFLAGWKGTCFARLWCGHPHLRVVKPCLVVATLVRRRTTCFDTRASDERESPPRVKSAEQSRHGALRPFPDVSSELDGPAARLS